MVRPLRLTDHPDRRTGLAAWGFQRNEGNSWEDEESKCLVIRCSFCYADNFFRLKKKKKTLVITLSLVQESCINSFRQLREKEKAFPEFAVS